MVLDGIPSVHLLVVTLFGGNPRTCPVTSCATATRTTANCPFNRYRHVDVICDPNVNTIPKYTMVTAIHSEVNDCWRPSVCRHRVVRDVYRRDGPDTSIVISHVSSVSHCACTRSDCTYEPRDPRHPCVRPHSAFVIPPFSRINASPWLSPPDPHSQQPVTAANPPHAGSRAKRLAR